MCSDIALNETNCNHLFGKEISWKQENILIKIARLYIRADLLKLFLTIFPTNDKNVATLTSYLKPNLFQYFFF